MELHNYLALSYPVELRQLSDEEGGGWFACIPALGRHLVRATGNSPDEALQELDATRHLFINDMYERRVSIPLPPNPEEEYSGNPGLRLPKEVHKLVAQRAREQGTSLNSYLNTLISLALGGDLVSQSLKQDIVLIRRDISKFTNFAQQISYHVQQSEPKTPLADAFTSSMFKEDSNAKANRAAYRNRV